MQCMQAGAFDYILKPVDRQRPGDHDSQSYRVFMRLNNKMSPLLHYLSSDEIKAAGKNLKKLLLAIIRCKKLFPVYGSNCSPSRFRYLSPGPTGGRQRALLRKTIHELSNRRGEFCGNQCRRSLMIIFSPIPLFGHKRGAFTGADRDRKGTDRESSGRKRFFLDENWRFAPGVPRLKLLRPIVGTRASYYPIGSDTAKSSRARIVCANQCRFESPAKKKGNSGRILYYRLTTHHIKNPTPWHSVKMILVPLLDHFVLQSCKYHGTSGQPAIPEELVNFVKQTTNFPGKRSGNWKRWFNDAMGRHQGGTAGRWDSFRGKDFRGSGLPGRKPILKTP